MCGSLRIAHLFGDCNPFSDLVSRAKWREFRQLCAQFGIKPVQEPMPVSCQNLYDVVMVEARTGGCICTCNRGSLIQLLIQL